MAHADPFWPKDIIFKRFYMLTGDQFKRLTNAHLNLGSQCFCNNVGDQFLSTLGLNEIYSY